MKFTRAILLIPLVLLSALHTSAQLGKIKNPLASLKNFTVEDGLPTNEIYKILEDQTGFIWICSDRGLITFDGSAFTVIDKSDGLPSNVILNIALAGDSGIYCLTNKSELFHYKQGAVTSIFNNAAFNALSVKFDDIKIRDLYVDPEDTLHIISSKPKKSTFYISVYNNKIKHIKAIADSTHSLIQYVENGITKLNAINYQFSGCFKSEIKKINKNLRLVTNTKHNLNIGKNGLFNKWRSYCLKNNKTDYYTIENELFSISDTNFYIQYADRHIFNIEQINSEIVLCTSLGLVLLTNLETENYKSDLGISQLFIDSRQNIWIATLSNGIQLIPHSVFDIKAKNLEKGHYFNTMSVLNNNVLIGTTRGNLYTFSSPNYTYLGTSKIPTRTLPITQIKHYKNNEYFVLNSSALYTYNIKSKKVTHLQKGATANQMIRHKTQIIGFKNTNTVTTIFDSSLNLLYKSIDLAKNKVDFEKYSNCYYYFNGQVLIGTNDGVYSFNPATKSFAQPAEYARFKQ
ncbi:MAG: two-component regulator propeller domain-containing protein, partial [Bacteroidia bacterium]